MVAGRFDEMAPGRADDLRRFVERGGAILVVPDPGDDGHVELTGVRIDEERPRAEWFVTLADRPEAARLDREVPLTTPLRFLQPVAAGVEVVATSSVGFAHRPVIATRNLGQGRVVSLGAGDLESVLDHPVVGRFVRRLLRGDDAMAAAPARTLGVGVVGYGPFGGMGYVHGLGATETDGLAFVAAVDPIAERLAVAGRDFPGLSTYESARQLELDDAVDIAIVATPPAHHAGLAIGLLEAGKHVVVEKPMCLTVADADRMLAAAAANGRMLTVHQSRRWDTDFLALVRSIELGTIGEVFNIETFVGGFEHPCRAWHSEASISGGAVYDWGSHHVDWILRLYGGPPEQVVTTSHKRVWLDVTNADQVSVWMRWSDGREAVFRQSDVAAVRRPKFYVQGTAGTIEGQYRPVVSETLEPGRGYERRTSHHAEAPVDLRVVRNEAGYGLVEQVLPPAPHPGWAFHRNLADHLLLGEPLAVPPQQSRDVVAVLEAAHRAGAGGSATVELDDGLRAW